MSLKSSAEIAAMREVGRLAADTLQRVGELIRPGITTADIDDFVVSDTRAKGAIAAPLGYAGTGGAATRAPFHGRRLVPGMTFTVEPMINLGGPEGLLLEDGWTVVTRDGSPRDSGDQTHRAESYELLDAVPGHAEQAAEEAGHEVGAGPERFAKCPKLRMELPNFGELRYTSGRPVRWGECLSRGGLEARVLVDAT